MEIKKICNHRHDSGENAIEIQKFDSLNYSKNYFVCILCKDHAGNLFDMPNQTTTSDERIKMHNDFNKTQQTIRE